MLLIRVSANVSITWNTGIAKITGQDARFFARVPSECHPRPTGNLRIDYGNFMRPIWHGRGSHLLESLEGLYEIFAPRHDRRITVPAFRSGIGQRLRSIPDKIAVEDAISAACAQCLFADAAMRTMNRRGQLIRLYLVLNVTRASCNVEKNFASSSS